MSLQLNGSEIVVEMLIREGVPYAIGIPGHGNLPLIDALRRRQDKIKVVMPRHEQAAVHMADGYFRASGQPVAVYTSIGAGAANTALGLATAYVDSIPLLVLIGETHTHMRGVGVLQEIDRQYWSDLPRVFDAVVKRSWRIDQPGQLPRAVSQAFNTMLTGRPGPALITLPMDVQAAGVELGSLPEPATRRPQGAPGGDPQAVQRAAELLRRGTAAGYPGRRRRAAGRRRARAAPAGRAPGRRRRHHHAGQKRLPRNPPALWLAHGQQRHHLRQPPDRARRRAAGGRGALCRQGHVLLSPRLFVQHPAHQADPRRHRSL